MKKQLGFSQATFFRLEGRVSRAQDRLHSVLRQYDGMVVKYAECRLCKAGKGAPCRKPSNERLRRPHAERIADVQSMAIDAYVEETKESDRLMQARFEAEAKASESKDGGE